MEAGLQSQAAYGFADAMRHFETVLELWDQVADPEQQTGPRPCLGAALCGRVGLSGW